MGALSGNLESFQISTQPCLSKSTYPADMLLDVLERCSNIVGRAHRECISRLAIGLKSLSSLCRAQNYSTPYPTRSGRLVYQVQGNALDALAALEELGDDVVPRTLRGVDAVRPGERTVAGAGLPRAGISTLKTLARSRASVALKNGPARNNVTARPRQSESGCVANSFAPTARRCARSRLTSSFPYPTLRALKRWR